MPTCPKCGVAFLDGQFHRCSRRRLNGFGGLIGVVAGALLGGLFVIVVVRTALTPFWDAIGFLFGVPAGAFIGGLIGIRVDRRRY